MHVLSSFFGANFGSFGGLSEAQKEQRRAGLDTWIIRVVTEMVGRLLLVEESWGGGVEQDILKIWK
jgi:hypothetical protein